MKDCLPVSLLLSWQRRTLKTGPDWTPTQVINPIPSHLSLQLLCEHIKKPWAKQENLSSCCRTTVYCDSYRRSGSVWLVVSARLLSRRSHNSRRASILTFLDSGLCCQVLQPPFVDIPTSIDIIDYAVQIMTPQSLCLLKEVLIHTLCGHSLLKIRSGSDLTQLLFFSDLP